MPLKLTKNTLLTDAELNGAPAAVSEDPGPRLLMLSCMVLQLLLLKMPVPRFY
jgi:hypothetical protein